MVRFFGKATAGAYADYDMNPLFTTNNYYCQVENGSMSSNVNNEAFMIHKTFPVDEEVWLTRDGVAKGEDDVVKRALAWIGSVPYACHTRLTQTCRDSVQAIAHVQNPLGHTLSVTVIVKNELGMPIDSVLLNDDGLHGDGAAGDNVWGGLYSPPTDVALYASVRTDDRTAGTTLILPKAANVVFARKALIDVDTRMVNLPTIDITLPHYETTFWVRNLGFAADTLTVSLDPGGVQPDFALSALPKIFTLAPGDSQLVTFSIRPNLLSPSLNVVTVLVESKSSFGQTKFEKVYQFMVLTLAPTVAGLPTEFRLGQNYPNPSNPATIITFSIPQSAANTVDECMTIVII